MLAALQSGLDGGIIGSLAQAATLAGSIVLVLILVGLGTYAYKNLRGDGIRWPDEESDDDGVSRAGDDEEWKYS